MQLMRKRICRTETSGQKATGKMIFFLAAFMFSQVFPGGDSVKPTRVEWHSDIAGTYSGTLYSAGRDIPVETIFHFEDAAVLGEYLMDEDSILTRGSMCAVISMKIIC